MFFCGRCASSAPYGIGRETKRKPLLSDGARGVVRQCAGGHFVKFVTVLSMLKVSPSELLMVTPLKLMFFA